MSSKSSLSTKELLTRLKAHARLSENNLRRHHPAAVKFFEERGITPGKIREHAARLAAAGALTGAVLLGGPIITNVRSAPSSYLAALSTTQRENLFSQKLKEILLDSVGLINQDQEKEISNLFNNLWGIKAAAQLEGEKLNQSYGLIGAEQHLPRYPGDSLDQHGEYLKEGITPGLGAWGYFAYSQNQLTADLVEKEKYYVAVQTLYLPDWQKRLPYLREWYKYRKVAVVNPENGKTIICDIADSGPSQFTGKHFGGSPEVMAYLGLNIHMQKGPVILFFVDDPHNEIPLGPVKYNVAIGPSKLAQR